LSVPTPNCIHPKCCDAFGTSDPRLVDQQ
jgi:hypothetical protein